MSAPTPLQLHAPDDVHFDFEQWLAGVRLLAVPPMTPWSTGTNIDFVRELADRWSIMPKGGHFAALEQPQPLVHEIREQFRSLR